MQLYNRSEAFPTSDTRPVVENTSDIFNMDRLAGVARRQWRVFVLCAAIAALVGVAYAQMAIPLYEAKISLLIDDGNSNVVEQLSAIDGVEANEGAVLSQIELLQSQTIALAVIDELKLVDNSEFMSSDGSLFFMARRILRSVGDVRRWFVSDALDSSDIEARRRLATAKIVDGINVVRIGKSYVLEVSYTSTSPQLASQIANALGDIYLRDKLDSKLDATRRASNWLQDRIAELREKVLTSDLDVQKFRAANGLVSAGNTLISDQQLQELNTALIVAKADSAKAKARYNRIEQILRSGQSDAIVVDVLDSSISNELRKKYLEASKLEADITKRLGPDHLRAFRLRNEMAEYKRLMFGELQRIAETYKSEFEIAEKRESEVEQSVLKAANVSASAGETQVQLRELERTSETYKNLYQGLLQRYQQAMQQQSFPVTDSRAISRARPPTSASFPRKPVVVILFLIMGCAFGIGAGAFREFRDRFFRTGEQVRDELGLEFLGIAPFVKGQELAIAAKPHNRTISKVNSVTNYVIDNPLSSFAETLRSTKIAADLALSSKPCRIIGIVSTLPGEGKSTIAINFAEMLAKQGARTALIDCDLRNPGATRAIAPHADKGILQVILENQPVQDFLLYNPETKLVFLPAVIRHRIPHSSELLTSASMQKALSTLSEAMDYIILDLPPLGPVVDARAMAPRIDGFILVTEWGKTSRQVVRHTLQTEQHIASKCIGLILNKVDYKKLKLYRSYGSMEYYYSRYSQYYYEQK